MTGLRQTARMRAVVAALALCAAVTPLRAQRISDTLAIQEQVLRAVRHQLDSLPASGRVVLDPASTGLANLSAAERQRLGSILRAVAPDSADRNSCLLRDRPPCSPAAADLMVIRIGVQMVTGDLSAATVLARTVRPTQSLQLGPDGGTLMLRLAKTPAGWRIISRVASAHGG